MASAVATGKRRSLLPALKSSAAGTSVAASRTGEVPTRKNKVTATVSGRALPSDLHPPAGLKGEITNRTAGDGGRGSKGGVILGKLTGSSVPSECHSGSESKQVQLRKASNLQRPTVTQRPSSASAVSNRSVRDFNHSSSLTKTLLDSGNSEKLTSVKGTAASTDGVDQNAKTKHRSLFHGTASVPSHSVSSGSTKQRKLPCPAETAAGKLKVPTKFVSDSTAVAESSLPEIVSGFGSSCSQDKTVLNEEQVVSTSLVTEIPDPDVTSRIGHVSPECVSSSSVEGVFGVSGGQECDRSLSSTDPVAGVSRMTAVDQGNDDSEHLASSSGSLGILDDTDLLDISLLSFDSSPTLTTVHMNEVEACCVHSENPPDDDTLLAVQLGSKQSSSQSDIDSQPRTSVDEVGTPSLRPVSLVSNSSTDVGIVADCTVHPCESRSHQDRPSSYMSTSSADTGTY